MWSKGKMKGLWLCNSDLRRALAWCYASLDLSEYVILYVHLSPIVDYYQKNPRVHVMYCWLHFRKKMQSEVHHQKMELLQSAPTRVPLINASFMARSFYFSSFFFSFSRHFSSFRWHQETCIIGIHLLPIGFIHVLLLNWYIWLSWWLDL